MYTVTALTMSALETYNEAFSASTAHKSACSDLQSSRTDLCLSLNPFYDTSSGGIITLFGPLRLFDGSVATP